MTMTMKTTDEQVMLTNDDAKDNDPPAGVLTRCTPPVIVTFRQLSGVN